VFVGGSPPFQKEGVAARPGQALAGKRNVKRAKNTSLYIGFVETGLTSQNGSTYFFTGTVLEQPYSRTWGSEIIAD
jgi:hypothetical protein